MQIDITVSNYYFLYDYPLKKPITYMISSNNGMLTKSYAIEGIYIEINAYIGGVTKIQGVL